MSIETFINTLSNSIAQSLATLPKSKIVELPKISSEDNANVSVKALIEYSKSNRNRLQFTWKFHLITTIFNYIILLLSIIGTMIFALIKGNALPTYILGGTSVFSIMGTLLWKPQSKLMASSIELTNLTSLSSALEMLYETIEKIPDEGKRAEKYLETIKLILNVLQKPK